MGFILGLVAGGFVGIFVVAICNYEKNNNTYVTTDVMTLSEYENVYYYDGITTNIENGKVTGFQVEK